MAVRKWREDTAPLPKIPESKAGRKLTKWWRPLMIVAAILAGCVVLNEAARAPSAPMPPVVITTPAPAPAVVVPETLAPVAVPALVRAPLVMAKTPGPCSVTSGKACVGEITSLPNGYGTGFLLEKGTVIFAPMSGKVSASASGTPMMAMIANKDKGWRVFIYNVTIPFPPGTPVKTGEPIGTVASNGNVLGTQYNVLVDATPQAAQEALYPGIIKHPTSS